MTHDKKRIGFQKFHKASRIGKRRVAVSVRILRAIHAPYYGIALQREVVELLNQWTGGEIREPLCVVCENRLTTAKAPPAFVLVQPYNEVDDDTVPGILSGVCSKCSLRSDTEIQAIMARHLFGGDEWKSIEEGAGSTQ